MGDKKVTIQNLEVIKSDIENNLIFVKGSVPGSKNSMFLIQRNSKQVNKKTTLEKIKKTQSQSSASSSKMKSKPKPAEKKELSKPKIENKEVKK